MTLQWCEITLDHLSPAQARKVPKWARRAALDKDGTIFLPGALAGSEMNVYLCAAYEGTAALLDGKHAYYPADWIAREFPAARDTALRAAQKIKNLLAQDRQV